LATFEIIEECCALTAIDDSNAQGDDDDQQATGIP
jgi:hypothetical protein